MILRALYDYYHRCGNNVAPRGLEFKEIAYVIVIDKKGNFIRLEDRHIDNKRCQKFLVVKTAERSSNPVANVLWDNCSYVLGVTAENLAKEVYDKIVDIAGKKNLLDSYPKDNWEKLYFSVFDKCDELSKEEDIESLIIRTAKEELKTDEKRFDKFQKDKALWQKEIDKNSKNHKVFIKKVDAIVEALQDERLLSIQSFYAKEESNYDLMRKDSKWSDLKKEFTKNISFAIEGDLGIVAEQTNIIEKFNNVSDKVTNENICLITGVYGKTVETTTATPILGSQAKAKLVSFQINSGYDSYGKEKAYNAPISEDAEFAYTTALNHMLRPDSHNKFSIGTRTFLFWASSDSDAAKASEDNIFAFFGYTGDDDPNKRIELVRQTFKSIYNGKLSSKKDDRFYILGLAPNSARIAVVYWAELPLHEFAEIIDRHFKDMEIEDNREVKKTYAGLHSILGAVTFRGKSNDTTPNLPDAVVKSIFQGLPYPTSLFQACIRRIRAEISKEDDKGRKINSVNITRAAIIKAYLNRLNDNNIKIKAMLDKENQNPGYLCGRLFAVLESLQYAANKQDTIRSSYMNAASSTPAAVFSTILKLSNSHYGKLAKDKKGLALFFDSQKEEILSMLTDFPETLELQDQGRFFLGYYHQKNYRDRNDNIEAEGNN